MTTNLIFIIMAIVPTIYSWIELDSRIVGGAPAQLENFPYQASIRRKTRHICGGSILSETKILTAAHCIQYKTKPLHVRVDIYNVNEIGQEFRVIRHVLHPHYNRETSINDVAVLTLDRPIDFDLNVQPINLRKQPAVPGEALTVSGWGRTSVDGAPAPFLQCLTVRALDVKVCKQLLSKNTFPIHSNHICTTSKYGKGTCKGDSGGPLVDANNLLIGIVSWGRACALGVPDVYTSVPHHYDWIMSQL